MYIVQYKLVVPQAHLTNVAAFAVAQEHGKIEAYQGTKAVDNYGITVQGSGTWAEGNIHGTVYTWDYHAVYKAYKLEESDSADYWFVHYQRDKSHDELRLADENSQKVELPYNVNFEIQGNDWGQSSVFITLEVIRLVVDGSSKDYVVTNDASAGANNADGSKYQGGFKLVQ